MFTLELLTECFWMRPICLLTADLITASSRDKACLPFSEIRHLGILLDPKLRLSPYTLIYVVRSKKQMNMAYFAIKLHQFLCGSKIKNSFGKFGTEGYNSNML